MFHTQLSPLDSIQYVVSHYRINQLIGKGGFADVYKAIQLYTKIKVAAKITNISKLSVRQIEQLEREVQIHKKLNHPNIVRIYEAFSTESDFYMFMQLAKGKQLFSHLIQFGPLKQSLAAKIFNQIVSAVQYMHDLNIAHRDIKTQNIIVDQNFNAKLIDFGLAKMYNSSRDDYLQTFCGSPSYVSPQLLSNRGYSGQRVDIWCLGVTLYVMLEACLPFDDSDKKSTMKKIKSCNWYKPVRSSPEAVQLYNAIFVEEEKRITLQDIMGSKLLGKHGYGHGKKEEEKIRYLPAKKQDILEELSQIFGFGLREIQQIITSSINSEILALYNILSNCRKRRIVAYHKYSKSEQKKATKDKYFRGQTVQSIKNRDKKGIELKNVLPKLEKYKQLQKKDAKSNDFNLVSTNFEQSIDILKDFGKVSYRRFQKMPKTQRITKPTQSDCQAL